MFHPWDKLAGLFERTLDKLDGAAPARVSDLRASSLFFFIYWLAQRERLESGRPVVLVTETTTSAQRMQQFLVAVERLVADREPSQSEYLAFPDFEPTNLFEHFDPPVEIIDARNQVLDALHSGLAKVVVASYKACWRKLPEPQEHHRHQLNLAPASVAGSAVQLNQAEKAVASEALPLSCIERSELASRLAGLGYRPVTTVTSVGEYALRGGLVDVYPIGEDQPLRIDLFGDEVETISRFDPQTQRSLESVAGARILPLSVHASTLGKPEVLQWLRDRWQHFTEQNRDQLSHSVMERLSEVVISDLELLHVHANTPRAGWYTQACISEECCLWHYLPEGTRVVIHEEGFVESETNSYFRFWQNRFRDWLRNGLSFLDLDSLYLQPQGGVSAVASDLANGEFVYLAGDQPQTCDVPALRPLLTNAFSALDNALPCASAGLDNAVPGKWGTARIAETIAGFPKVAAQDLPTGGLPVDRPVSVLSQFSARLREVLSDAGLHPEIENAILPGGFVIPQASPGSMPAASSAAESAVLPAWTVVTDVEVFGEIADVVPQQRRRYTRDAIRRTDELSPGDFVVHIDYGIGRFAQLTDRQVSGVTRSYVEVEYAGRDRLFVPVEQLDRLRRYSFDGTAPQLNNLGRDAWKRTKDKVRQDTLELAKRLLSLYKTRQVRPGHAYIPRTVWEDEFAEGFPYTLTEDQLRAWRDVEQDMQNERPMERLLCGDVGFGKTEIAMRAAFKACVDGRQVLVLCPTTVLADQHFHTFSRRFRPFPFNVAQLSRFQSKAEQKEVVKELQAGKVDLVIATHRGLSKDIEFQRLGLLVIDEEQRFGVKQKEGLKMHWPDVDVLAMSATPIPRTLHMSLVGLRDISVIETPPGERKPVKTYVGEFDEIMVREAILRELGRGGQVYYLHNRVADIERVREQLLRLFPEERMLVAHGQMREDKLEEVMHAFSLGAYNIMLATTIIENGLDIPSVNTLVVDHAENLGLAQMHQLRGRVGRSAVQAYSYFFHDSSRILTEEAQNRLHAIYNYAYLGAGYEIAQSDLRIRGAGNLLGEAQSGLARAVGFEYYCELLARSIKDVRELDSMGIEEWEDRPLLPERPATQIDLPMPAFIPHDYIEDPVLRLDILRELAGLASEEAALDFAVGLEDRFGTPPQEVLNLLTVVNVRNLATRIGCERLSYNRVKHSFTLQFFDDEPEWFRQGALLDSRFAQSGMHALDFSLSFEGAQTAETMYEALQGLARLKEQAQAGG